jgi:phosphomevalonate kinase
VRRLLRSMGDMAGVPIEPIEQTQLLDEMHSIPGVVFAGVPGGKRWIVDAVCDWLTMVFAFSWR